MNEEEKQTEEDIRSKVWRVPPANVIGVWRDCWEMVAEALEKGEPPHHYDHWEFLNMCLLGQAQLWIYYDDGIKLVKITRIQEYPKAKALVDMITSGHGALDDGIFWEMQDEIEHYAESVGCKFIEGIGRFGWERVGKQCGYKRHFIVLTKEL